MAKKITKAKAERAKRADVGEFLERDADRPKCLAHFSPLPCPICAVGRNERREAESVPDSVDLIASGYEWTCPTCDGLNKEIEIPKSGKVTCPVKHRGKRVFQVGEADHVNE